LSVAHCFERRFRQRSPHDRASAESAWGGGAR
jgi:hypothetical protein